MARKIRINVKNTTINDRAYRAGAEIVIDEYTYAVLGAEGRFDDGILSLVETIPEGGGGGGGGGAEIIPVGSGASARLFWQVRDAGASWAPIIPTQVPAGLFSIDGQDIVVNRGVLLQFHTFTSHDSATVSPLDSLVGHQWLVQVNGATFAVVDVSGASGATTITMTRQGVGPGRDVLGFAAGDRLSIGGSERAMAGLADDSIFITLQGTPLLVGPEPA